jgi:hypothetical protein
MTSGRECPELCKVDLPLRAVISEINRRSNDIAVPRFILSGAPNLHQNAISYALTETPATTHGRCRLGWGTRTSSTRCDTLS